ncbi:glycerate kinase type-2 family protein [Gimibacter soli]|uniref:DUF4147 domain-containing protein n=1 Tax=Gimibacter soli TaxID=3024400 RepID=A0AAE9XMM7_9PROT|nr:DUF4147 domain-containing protein [Gimibacter soli]WCL52837.1 DUF4147 domain-containing protein [Gimibacter soli]
MPDQPVDWPAHVRALYKTVTSAAEPGRLTAANLPDDNAFAGIRIVALGKAAVRMARAAEEAYAGHRDVSGVVIAKSDEGWLPSRLRFMPGSHPVPDERSLAAGEAALQVAAGAGPDDLFLVLLSGGGSALAVAPAHGVTLADKQAAVKALLASGAPIDEINAKRRQMSRLKGGGLARAAHRAREIVTLALSDVVGDDPATIASGSTWLGHDDKSARYELIGSGRTGLDAATAYATAQGWDVIDWGDAVTGDVRVVVRDHAAKFRALQAEITKPALVISGGEVTSTLPEHAGAGGPNQDYALSLMVALEEAGGIFGVAFDTDGCDGIGGGAGGWFTPESLADARAKSLDPIASLKAYASLDFLAALGTQIPEAASGTNINDFRAVLLLPLTKD